MRPLWFAAALLTVAIAMTFGAPKGPPGPDHVTGEYAKRLDSPVVLVAGEKEVTYWLVFSDASDESAALGNLDYGTRITVRGRCGTGGQYRYFTPSVIEKAE